MAVTKIHAITGTLKKALDYIMNEKKTDEKLLVSSYNCVPEIADIEFTNTRYLAQSVRGREKSEKQKNLAHHMIQSFVPGETNPEIAHKIGQEWAEKVLAGKYEFVLTTHIDKGHIHNHIIFNAVSSVDFKKFNSCKKTKYDLREASDELCKNHGLNVIEKHSGVRGKEYKQWKEEKQGTSWKQKLQFAIDKNINKAKNFDDFLKLMERSGYEVKQGKYIAFRHHDQERFTRAYQIGEAYTEDKIKSRINKNTQRVEAPKKITYTTKNTKSVDLAHTVGFKAYPYRHTSSKVNEIANLISDINRNNISRYSDFEKKIAECEALSKELKDNLKIVETKASKLKELAKLLVSYNNNVELYKNYQKAFNKEKFYSRYESQLRIFEYAKAELDKLKIDLTVNVDVVVSDYKNIEQQRQKLYNDYTAAVKKLDHIKDIKNNTDKIIYKVKKLDKKITEKKTKNIDNIL